jgi:flagellar biosynthesis component FlhA
MGGAMRFVQGDAVAGMFIIGVNIIGGIYIGLSNGMPFSDAVDTYTVLTVGDALVAQIPALLVSITAGMVVTRVSSGENTTLGSDMGQQLFGRPGLTAFAGAMMIIAAMIPGLPPIPFLTVGFAILAASWFLSRSRRPVEAIVASRMIDFTPTLGLPGGRGAEDEHADEQSILIRLDPQRLYKQYRAHVATYQDWWRDLRAEVASETGIQLPELRIMSQSMLAPLGYQVVSGEIGVEDGIVPVNGSLVMLNPDSAHVWGLSVVAEAEHPFCGARVFWTSGNQVAQRRLWEALGLKVWDPVQFVMARAAAFLIGHPEEVLRLSDVHIALKSVERRFPGLVTETVDPQRMGVARLTELLQALARDGVNVRDIRQVLESIGAFQAACSDRRQSDIEFDELIAAVRIARRRQLSSRFATPRRRLRVLELGTEVERIFDESAWGGLRDSISVDFEVQDRLYQGLYRALGPIMRRGTLPIAIVCRGELRGRVQEFLHGFNQRRKPFAGEASSQQGSLAFGIGVLAREEIDSSVNREAAGIWNM